MGSYLPSIGKSRRYLSTALQNEKDPAIGGSAGKSIVGRKNSMREGPEAGPLLSIVRGSSLYHPPHQADTVINNKY